jgi:hypothetical protein
MPHMPENANYFIGWGTLALINAGLAQPKGRSGLLWWFASLLLGPLATFLIVVLPQVPQEVRPPGQPPRVTAPPP